MDVIHKSKKKTKNKKAIKLCNWMKCFNKTHHKPHFQYMCINFSFFIGLIDFWSPSAQGNVVMDAIYKRKKNIYIKQCN
jgi:hypothetical protein